jgi:hypothetical protein
MNLLRYCSRHRCLRRPSRRTKVGGLTTTVDEEQQQSNKQQPKGDYVFHKGSMYFAFYWINFHNNGKLFGSLVNSWAGCEVDAATYLLIITATVSFEFTLYCLLEYKYGGDAFRRRFVTYHNVIGFTLLILISWMACYFWYLPASLLRSMVVYHHEITMSDIYIYIYI